MKSRNLLKYTSQNHLNHSILLKNQYYLKINNPYPNPLKKFEEKFSDLPRERGAMHLCGCFQTIPKSKNHIITIKMEYLESKRQIEFLL